MAQNDNAVVTAAVGYVFIAEPGTARPTPAELAALDLDALVDGKAATTTVDAGDGSGTTKTVKAGGSLPAAWTNIGHTSRGDLPEFGFDGGDTEVRGTWQNESLREVETKPIGDFLKMALHQFDTETFELYYGKNASKDAGVFGVAGGNSKSVEKALLIVIVDGDVRIGFYSPKASVRRDDSISLKTDEFAALPVRATFLKDGTKNKFEWINEDLFV